MRRVMGKGLFAEVKYDLVLSLQKQADAVCWRGEDVQDQRACQAQAQVGAVGGHDCLWLLVAAWCYSRVRESGVCECQ